MGLLKFLVPRRQRLSPEAAQWAYVTGIDGVAWPSKNRQTDEGLEIERVESDSGNVNVLWAVKGHGLLTLATTTLRERDRPYLLPVELARGTVSRIRNQIAEWVAAGLQLPARVRQRLREAQVELAQAATGQHEPLAAADHAERCISQAVGVIHELVAAFSAQSLSIRHQQMPRLATLYGADLGTLTPDGQVAERVKAAFNTAQIPLGWRGVESQEGKYDWQQCDRQIQWCRANGIKICSGPLIRLAPGGMPDWLYLWEGDFDRLQTFMTKYVEAVVQRYVGKINVWQCAARVNAGAILSLSEEQKLRLAAHTIEVVRSIDERAPVIISFDQPWTEYMGREEHDQSGFYLADTLVRAQLGLAGIGLEINLAYYPGGTLPRHPLDVNRQIDNWSRLSLPLVVILTAPSGDAADAQCRGPIRPVAEAAKGGLSPASQRAWVAALVPLLLAKPAVQGIIWNQLSDAEPHEMPHGGLFDTDGQPKPALDAMTALREAHLT